MALIEDLDKAVRLARSVASDISLYNEDKIKEGIAQDTLFDVLAAELDEGREFYRGRVAGRVDAAGHLFDEAVVNIIIRSRGHIPSKMW